MKAFFLIIAFACIAFQTKSQVVINEFMASNTGLIQDPDFGASSDWIELYNAGTATVNLNGYAITDNISDPQKWKITGDILLGPKSFILIWADDLATGLHTSFKLSAEGEELGLTNPSGEMIDSLIFSIQDPNISMGRITDGATFWGFFSAPTPGKPNGSDSYKGIVKNQPDFTPLGGIFNQPISVILKNTFGGDIRYTLDGSEPGDSSALYLEPITISEHTVIRARIYQQGMMPGSVVTHSYFINDDGSVGSLPVVSIASAPANFWDPEIGIYVQNFKPDREIPVNIELFENDGSDRAGFNLAAGTKINGLYSWQLPQKMLGIYFRKAYGESKLEYPLFFDKSARSFNSFALRASGNDWANTLFRDGMIQNSTQPDMDVETQGFRACVLFINGQYMGIHNMRSKVDEDYIVESNHLGDAQIDMIAYEDTVEAGDFDQYKAFEALYHQDLSVQANFDLVAQQMDIGNFTDFIISEIYSGNTSIDHNVMAWKPKDFGKWRWLLADLDRGFFNPENNMISYYLGRSVYPFSNLMKNPDYLKTFGYRFADLLFTTFNPERMNGIIDGFAKNIEAELPRHIERWKGTSSSYGNPISSVAYWQGQVQNLKTFAERRPAILLGNLKNYGFGDSENLSISSFPAGSGKIRFNGLSIPSENCLGQYPVGGEISLQADALSGYTFKGWELNANLILIPEEDIWKYNDTGAALAEDWKEASFDDSSWPEGKAELGYGDGDENTQVGYGPSASRKFLCTYFRREFTVDQQDSIPNLVAGLKYDDGAVVYLNGKEVIRVNMAMGAIDHTSPAINTVSGSAESKVTNFSIDASLLKNGQNCIAVEIHQDAPNSSDISFDLQLTAVKPGNGTLVSTEKIYKFTMNEATNVVALFERDNQCIIPPVVAENLRLDKNCSPYMVTGDVQILAGATLSVDSGVEILMPDGASFWVKGALITNGTPEEPVRVTANPQSANKRWGAILIEHSTGVSWLKNTIIEGASMGPNPTRNVAAISLFHSTAKFDGLKIENVWANPVAARYSDVSITNSFLHSAVTGDLVNLKYGKGRIENCEFVGNDQPDTDAIDYDNIENGVIRNCLIRDFHGINSDAIDLGEKAINILIDSIMVYNITDKGVSVGQQSSASIRNSIFVNCNLGAALKDSSKVVIDHSTFYGCVIPVASFEKNAGSAGGNGSVTNSILSNSYESSFLIDEKSTLVFSNSLSDNDLLPNGNGNLFGDPLLINPGAFDFLLNDNSPARNTGSTGNIGATRAFPQIRPMIGFSAIGYNVDGIAVPEFLAIRNPGSEPFDLSGFKLSKGVTFPFPAGSVIKPGGQVIVTENALDEEWERSEIPVFQWEIGRLADEGETIQLLNQSGIIFDQLKYLPENPWPVISVPGQIIVLKDLTMDNHFGKNWRIGSIDDVLNLSNILPDNVLSIYPNPTSGIIEVSGLKGKTDRVLLFNFSGVKIAEYPTDGGNQLHLNLQQFNPGIYILRCGNQSFKVVKR